MGNWENALRKLINERYGSLRKFTQQKGLPYMTIYNMLNRGIANSKTETVEAFYNALNVDWSTLRDWGENSDYHELRLVPVSNGEEFASQELRVYGRIAAETVIGIDDGDFGAHCPTTLIRRYPKAFYMIVPDDSMSRILPEGSYALIDPEQREEIVSGQPYAVRVNGCNATIKRVRKLANGIELVPDSIDPTYRPRLYDMGIDGTETVTIIGRVVWYTVPLTIEFQS